MDGWMDVTRPAALASLFPVRAWRITCAHTHGRCAGPARHTALTQTIMVVSNACLQRRLTLLCGLCPAAPCASRGRSYPLTVAVPPVRTASAYAASSGPLSLFLVWRSFGIALSRLAHGARVTGPSVQGLPCVCVPCQSVRKVALRCCMYGRRRERAFPRDMQTHSALIGGRGGSKLSTSCPSVRACQCAGKPGAGRAGKPE